MQYTRKKGWSLFRSILSGFRLKKQIILQNLFRAAAEMPQCFQSQWVGLFKQEVNDVERQWILSIWILIYNVLGLTVSDLMHWLVELGWFVFDTHGTGKKKPLQILAELTVLSASLATESQSCFIPVHCLFLLLEKMPIGRDELRRLA